MVRFIASTAIKKALKENTYFNTLLLLYYQQLCYEKCS